MALRFGVCGTGYWAQEAHATALAASDAADLVGVWGRDPSRTEAVAARFGIDGFADLDRLLAEVDAVAMAVPPDVQATLACSSSCSQASPRMSSHQRPWPRTTRNSCWPQPGQQPTAPMPWA